MPEIKHDHTATAKDMIGRTIARLKRDAQHLDCLVNTWPDVVSKSQWEFFKKLNPLIDEQTKEKEDAAQPVDK